MTRDVNMNSGGERVMGPTTEAQGKVRLYEVAKDLGLANKDLVAKVRALGIEVKNHMSNLDVEDVARVKRALDKERQANLVEERLSSTVIRRRSKDGSQLRPAQPAQKAAEPVREARASHAERTEERAHEERPSTSPSPSIDREDHVEERVESRPVVERVKEAVVEAVHEVAAKAHVLVEKVAHKIEAPAVEEKPQHREPKHEPRVEKPQHREPEPRVEPATAQPSAEAKPEAPKKEEPVKYGPTGRVIELPLPRIEIRQADPRDRFAQRDTRTLPGQRREMPGQRDRFGRPQQGKKKAQVGKKQKQTQITTPAAHKRVVKMDESITVSELARQMGVKAPDVLKKLWGMGMTGIMLNNSIDQDAATLVSNDFGFEVESTAFQEADVFAAADDKPEDL